VASAGRALIVVENNSVPFDCRVWREAKALHEAGWEVSVISPQSPQDDRLVRPDSQTGSYEVLDGIHIYRFPLVFADHGIMAYIREYATAIAHIARLSWHVCCGDGFDVLQVCNPPDVFFPLGLFYRLLSKGFVFDHHDLAPESISFRFHGPRGLLLYRSARLFEWLTFRTATVVMATNESYRQLAIQRGGVDPSRVFVVRNGPELASIQPVPPDPALKRNFPYLVCYLGVMGVEDGVVPMLEAIRFAVQDMGREDICFVLIGDGTCRPAGLSLVAQWGLESKVFMPGRLPEKEVKRYLASADVCLSPDPFTPLNDLSTMNKVMEYMIMGKPLVSFDLKEARFSAQEAALYVPCDDTKAFGRGIVELLDNADRRNTMGEFGRKRVLQELAWEKQKPNLLAAYEAAKSYKRGYSRP
jgi:glycosyltransferase involved in cell wall biosynthesis